MLDDLIKKNRSYRRFFENHFIEEELLYSLIEFARLSPSPRNQQALKFFISNTENNNSKIFKTLAWAGALIDWEKPQIGERPSAYIIILGDNSIIPKETKTYHDVASGIVAQSILLGATEKGLGGCMIAAIKRKVLRDSLKLDKKYEILMVLALGKPKENVLIEKMPENGNFDYWRDENMIHHVPKRSLVEIVLK